MFIDRRADFLRIIYNTEYNYSKHIVEPDFKFDDEKGIYRVDFKFDFKQYPRHAVIYDFKHSLLRFNCGSREMYQTGKISDLQAFVEGYTSHKLLKKHRHKKYRVEYNPELSAKDNYMLTDMQITYPYYRSIIRDLIRPANNNYEKYRLEYNPELSAKDNYMLTDMKITYRYYCVLVNKFFDNDSR